MKITKHLCEGITVNAEEEIRYLKCICYLNIIVLLFHICNCLAILYRKQVMVYAGSGKKEKVIFPLVHSYPF